MASRKKIPPNRMEETISQILTEYKGEIEKDLEKAVREVAKSGVSELKANSRSEFGGTGRYASGWTSKTETDRLLHTSIIYNRMPGLPHLLEHGHALRGGGRSGFVDGKMHIAPVEEKVIEQFERELIHEIQ